MTRIKRINLLLLSVPAILLVPLIGTQLSDQVQWTPFDFLVMGTLLICAVLLLEFVLRKVKSKRSRILYIGILFLLFLLLWVELAVGILGSPLAGS